MKRNNFCSVEILSLSIFFLHFEKVMRVTPSFPQRGKQPKGSIPLTPLSISPISKENFSSTF